MGRRAKGRHEEHCVLGKAVEVIAARWKGEVLWFLQDRPKRFMELRRHIPFVSPRVLTHKLRELERDGLVSRAHHPEIPPRVEYSMTPLGRSAVPILKSIEAWWKTNESRVRDTSPGTDRDTGNVEMQWAGARWKEPR